VVATLRRVQRAHLVSAIVTVGFQPASVRRILASSPVATGGRDTALLAGCKPPATVFWFPGQARAGNLNHEHDDNAGSGHSASACAGCGLAAGDRAAPCPPELN